MRKTALQGSPHPATSGAPLPLSAQLEGEGRDEGEGGNPRRLQTPSSLVSSLRLLSAPTVHLGCPRGCVWRRRGWAGVPHGRWIWPRANMRQTDDEKFYPGGGGACARSDAASEGC